MAKAKSNDDSRAKHKGHFRPFEWLFLLQAERKW